MGSHQSGAEGQNVLLRPVPTLLGMQPRARLAFGAVSARCQVMMSCSSTSSTVKSFSSVCSPQTVQIPGVALSQVQDLVVTALTVKMLFGCNLKRNFFVCRFASDLLHDVWLWCSVTT